MKRTAVIMAGGAGERFWPLSRQSYPKQLLRIAGNRSMLSASAERIMPLVAPEDIHVVTSSALKPAIEAEAGVLPPENIIGEPEGRNTSACLALAAAFLQQKYGEDVVTAVLTADHFIRDSESFALHCAVAFDYAEKHDALVTFGIVPDRPDTGYGYIEVGAPAPGAPGVSKVTSFREKPNLETARDFVASGRFLWNSGMFFWRNSVITEAFRTALPAAHAQIGPMAAALARPEPGPAFSEAFRAMPKISIDFGVLEKVTNVAVVRATFDWDDIGTWNSISRLLDGDPAGNATYGNAVAVGCTDSVLYSADTDTEYSRAPLVVGFNLKDTIVVRVRDAVLVLPADNAQQVRDVVNYLRERGYAEYL